MYSVYLLYFNNRVCFAGCVYDVTPLVTVIDDLSAVGGTGYLNLIVSGISCRMYALGAPLSRLHLIG